MRDVLINALAWGLAAFAYIILVMLGNAYRAAERLHVVKVERER